MSADLTVVISTHARPVEVREAVAAIVAQDHPGVIETIVVFDKADPDRSLVSDDQNRPVVVMANHRGDGLPGSRNAGAEAASADVIGFCDDDDLWLPSKARLQLAAIVGGADVVTSGIVIESDGELIERRGTERPMELSDLLRSRRVEANMVTAMVSREAFLHRIGPMDQKIPGGYAEDYEWMLRAARIAPITVIPEPLVRVRWGTPSYFRDRWIDIDQALGYVLDRFPEFRSDKRGRARIEGQRAFARAAARTKGRWPQIGRTLGANPLEPRGWLAFAVAGHLTSADTVLSGLNRRGRGI